MGPRRGVPGGPGGRPPGGAPRPRPGPPGNFPGRGGRAPGGAPEGGPSLGPRVMVPMGRLITDPTGDAFRKLHAMHRSCPRQQRDSREGPRAVTHLLGDPWRLHPKQMCRRRAARRHKLRCCPRCRTGVLIFAWGPKPMLGNQRHLSHLTWDKCPIHRGWDRGRPHA